MKTRKSEASRTQGSEIKRNTYLYQPIAPLSAPKVQELIQLLDGLCVFPLLNLPLIALRSRPARPKRTEKRISSSYGKESTNGGRLYKLQLGIA